MLLSLQTLGQPQMPTHFQLLPGRLGMHGLLFTSQPVCLRCKKENPQNTLTHKASRRLHSLLSWTLLALRSRFWDMVRGGRICQALTPLSGIREGSMDKQIEDKEGHGHNYTTGEAVVCLGGQKIKLGISYSSKESMKPSQQFLPQPFLERYYGTGPHLRRTLGENCVTRSSQ